MNKHLKTIICGVIIICTNESYSQSTVLGNAGGAGNYLGWNAATTVPLQIRHDNNRQIQFFTTGIFRARLNPNINTTVNTYIQARNGFMGLGQDLGGIWSSAAGTGPFSLLHLNGTGTFVQEAGFRPWMQTGITFTSNNDLSYMGQRKIGAGTDLTETVIGWSDNPSGIYGPDVVSFRFTALTGGAVGNVPDLNGEDIDGREVVRMMGTGNVGIGPRFDQTVPNSPQSTLHQHQENAASSWFQISNQFLAGGAVVNAGPTAVTASDGLRLGILGNNGALRNGIGMLYNQENRALLFSTNANTNTSTPVLTQERMRVMSANTPTFIPFPLVAPLLGSYIPYNPAGVGTDITRVSVSHDPTQPLIRPLSLMHLGYNALVSATNVFYDGWRPWMDIGTYTSSKFDNMYVGLKSEGLGGTYDAVINWGRNQDSIPDAGPDHLRFIFSTNYAVSLPVDSNNANNINALEMGRFYPGRDTTSVSLNLGKYTYGRFGVGDFTAAGLNQEPSHKLDVDGNGRFRLLPDSLYLADSTVNKIVMVDENGVLRWSEEVPSEFGYACGDTTNIVQLTSDRYIPFHDHTIYFEGDGIQGVTPPTNAMALGYGCGDLLPAKFDVWQQDSTAVLVNTIAGSFINNDRCSSFVSSKTYIAVEGRTESLQPGNTTNMGGNFIAARAPINIAVKGTANASPASTNSFGGFFQSLIPNANRNYGVYVEANGGTTNNYGIYAKAPTTGGTTGPNYAGYFDGDVVKTGADNFTSDSILKEHIDTITNALSIINQLKPKTFNYKQSSFPSMSLPGGLQYGLIAQDVEAILPDLVSNNTHPAKYDSLGTLIYAAVNFKGLEYTQLIPIMIKAIQEQNDSIKANNDNLDSIVAALNHKNHLQDSIIATLSTKNDEQDSAINALRDDFNALKACIDALHLCDSPSMLAPNDNSHSDNATNIELKDAQTVILDQNVPNPFAEMTSITYTLNDGVQKAQMLFYNATGKLINSQDLQTTSGKGQLNVFANDLSNGIYTYTLVVDGKIIDTKRMVKNK